MMKFDATISVLTSIPANDCDFKAQLQGATGLQIRIALEVMRNRDGKDKGRIKACDRELRRRVKR